MNTLLLSLIYISVVSTAQVVGVAVEAAASTVATSAVTGTVGATVGAKLGNTGLAAAGAMIGTNAGQQNH